MNEKSRSEDLNQYKIQLRDKYRLQVMKIAERAKNQIDKTQHDQSLEVQQKYGLNDEIQMGSDDSFDSDQQREIALLDQQWNDLVNEYIEDPNLMQFPPNTEDRFVMQSRPEAD